MQSEKLKCLALSIGIFGCMFKLMSWSGASFLLIIGLYLLGVYLLLKVFEKKSDYLRLRYIKSYLIKMIYQILR